MFVLGLTGGIACGKSSVLRILQEKGIAVLSADQVVHKLLVEDRKLIDEVVKEFGKQIVTSDERIDRKVLGEIVFSDKEKKMKLESMLHPRVQQEFLEWKRVHSSTGLLVYEIPLLFEKQREKDFDAILCISSDLKAQVSRMKQRDNLSEDQIHKRLASQMDLSEKEERADFVIYNNSDKEHLITAVERLLEELPRP